MPRRWHLFWVWLHDMAKGRAYQRYLRHCDRLAHYQKQYGMHDLPMDKRPAINAVAHQLATEEMLTEIHAMLRHLCKATI